MKRITTVLLICMLTISSFSVTVFASSYEKYMAMYSRSNRSSYSRGYSSVTYSSARKYAKTNIPALMYHKITANPAEVTDYVITGEMLKADFDEIKTRGYTPIFVSEYYDLVDVYKSGGDDNNKKIIQFFENNPNPIIITFDDGYEGIYTHVLPLMKEYGFKVNFYICGELIDKQNPEYCTWDELKELAECEFAEIGNHTYGLHKNSKERLDKIYMYNLYDAMGDINFNRTSIKEKTGVDSVVFSFPYGLYDEYVIDIMKTYGYKYFISTDYRSNSLSDNRSTLGRFNRPASFATKEFFDLIEKY